MCFHEIVMRNGELRKFIIITVIVRPEHDSASREKALGAPWLEDLRALGKLAHARSVAGAADRLIPDAPLRLPGKCKG